MSLSQLRARRRAAVVLCTTALAVGTLVVAAPGVAGADGNAAVFVYTGDTQAYVVPADVCEVTVDAMGASGGASAATTDTEYPDVEAEDNRVDAQETAAFGGHTSAVVPVTPGETLTVVVGGAGTDADIADDGITVTGGTGGFNGGIGGGTAASSSTANGVHTDMGVAAGGSGGASDVRRGSNLTGRVVVAGGGGSSGVGMWSSQELENSSIPTVADGDSGAGGGSVGTAGSTGALGGGGGTQSTGGDGGTGTGSNGTAGSAGTGGTGGSTGAVVSIENGILVYESVGGAGGGGWFGGGGGAATSQPDFATTPAAGGGGGGSGHGPAGTTFETGVHEGNGVVVVTPATPGLGCDTTLQVAKVVTGPPGTGAVVQVDCDGIEPGSLAVDVQGAELAFLADGTPDPTDAPEGWEVVDGVWQVSDHDLLNDTCTATEIDDGGAQSVSYACTWTVGADEGDSSFGCPGPTDGPSASPRSVTLVGDGDVGRLTLTNTFPSPVTPPIGPSPAAALVAAPRFTG